LFGTGPDEADRVIFGLTLIATAFPMSFFFTNRSKKGRVVFGLVGAFFISEDFSRSCWLYFP
jgi:hypothetical protein